MVSESLYLGAVAVSSAVGLAMAVLLDRRTSDTAARIFVWLLVLHPVLGVLVIAELLAPHPSTFARLAFGGHTALGTLIPIIFFVFVLAYVGRPLWRRRWVQLLLGGWALAVVGLLVTNPFTGILSDAPGLVTEPFRHYATPTPTGVLDILFLPAPLAYFGGLGILGHRFVYGSRLSRRQTAFLFVGFLPALVTMALWIAGTLPGPLGGAFAVGSSWSLGFVGWAVFRHDLFDLVPTARRTVFAELHDPVVVVDDDHRLLDYNAAAAETFPALVGAAGEPVGELISGLEGAEGEDAEGTFVERFKHYGQYGAFDYDVTTSTLSDGDDVRGHALVIRDVTERQQRLRDLEQQTTQLQRFASVLSHDLRNPLNVAAGRVELARETGDVSHLEDAERALDRIGVMIEDLLTLSREGRTINDREAVSLPDVLRAAWETTDTAEAELAIDADADVAVFADPTRLQNVFENLVRNAIEHGGPDVTVRLGRHDDGFYVEDDGPGIPPEDRPHAFEFEFTTAESGTGLGLAIVETIARAHGWSVHVEGGTDGGTRIVFGDVDVIADEEPNEEGETDAADDAPPQTSS